MALTEAFKEAVKSGNIQRVRIMMKNSLLVDPSFKEFDEMEKEAESMKGLYDVHDDKDFEKDEAKWNDNYMNEQMVKLISNFSRERIKHVKEVVSYLRPVSCKEQKHKDQHNVTKGSPKNHISYKEQKRKDQDNVTKGSPKNHISYKEQKRKDQDNVTKGSHKDSIHYKQQKHKDQDNVTKGSPKNHIRYKEQKRTKVITGAGVGAVAGAIVGGIGASTAVTIEAVESAIAIVGISVSTIGITIAGGALVGAAVGGILVSTVANGGN